MKEKNDGESLFLKHNDIFNKTIPNVIYFENGVFLSFLPVITFVKSEVGASALSYVHTPFFQASETAARIALKFGVWLGIR